mmetsp:Transcript_20548/g.29012  ORF Transcript_20548/g.29012 Transcript_20548/m.29012 type:complete len:640 (+) Transcript_20548:192-2111(+)
MIAFTTPTARRLLCLMAAASALSSSNAFLTSSATTTINRMNNDFGGLIKKTKVTTNFEKSTSTYSPGSCSMVGMKTAANDAASVSSSQEEFNKRYNNIQEVNIDLDRMAQRIGTQAEKYPVQAAAQCQDLYEQVLASSKLDADVITFNTVLKAWSRVAGSIADTHLNYSNNNNSPADIDFAQMPSIPIYTARDAAEYATKLLMEAEQKQSGDNGDAENKNSIILPDRTSYNVAIDAWAKSRCQDAPDAAERLLKKMLDHERVKPDTLSYNGVLDAWAYSKSSPDYIERLHKIFSHMEQLHEDPETRLVKPTIRTVNTIINAHAKRAGDYSNNGPDSDPEMAMKEATKAHDWLNKMQKKYEDTNDEDYMPDVMTYTSVLDAYSRCGQYHGTMKAEGLLSELKQKYEKTGNFKLQPNFRTYTSLIVAWSKTRSPDAPKRAEEILEEMNRLYEEQLARGGVRHHEESFKPNSRTYTGVIQCWARSRDPNKAQRALKLLRTMKDKYKAGDYDVRPNVIAYNSAIDACARVKADSAKQMEALKIAFAILKSVEVEKNMRPTGIMYATLMRAVSSLMPPGKERSDISKAVFDKAVAAGMVDYGLLKFMRQAMDNEKFHELLHNLEDGRGNIDFNRMPSAWRKNLK